MLQIIDRAVTGLLKGELKDVIGEVFPFFQRAHKAGVCAKVIIHVLIIVIRNDIGGMEAGAVQFISLLETETEGVTF